MASEPGTGPAAAEEFLSAFDTMASAVRRARGAAAGRDPSAEDRLSLSQHGLLAPLATADGARVSDLAAQADVAASTATRILDALERRGLVRRVRSRADRRGVVISLTEEGRDVFARQDRWMRARQRAFYEQLPADEQALVADLLVRLAGLIDELSAGPGAGAQ